MKESFSPTFLRSQKCLHGAAMVYHISARPWLKSPFERGEAFFLEKDTSFFWTHPLLLLYLYVNVSLLGYGSKSFKKCIFGAFVAHLKFPAFFAKCRVLLLSLETNVFFHKKNRDEYVRLMRQPKNISEKRKLLSAPPFGLFYFLSLTFVD